MTHILRKVDKEARMDPPIQVEYFRSGGAYILIFVSLDVDFLNSDNNLSPNPLKSVEPPDKRIFEYKDERRSMSTFEIELQIIWCSPRDSLPIISG